MIKLKFPSILVLTLLLLSSPVKQSHAADVGGWIGGGFCSLLYTPLKMAFAVLMGVTGGLSMIATVPAGDTNASAQIVKWGIYGDWLIRPDHLRGQSPVRFVGTENRARFVLLDTKSRFLQGTDDEHLDRVYAPGIGFSQTGSIAFFSAFYPPYRFESSIINGRQSTAALSTK